MWLVAKTKLKVAWPVPKKQDIRTRKQIWLLISTAQMRMQKASVALHDNFIEDRSVRLNWHTNIDKYKNDAKLKKKGCNENSLFSRKVVPWTHLEHLI